MKKIIALAAAAATVSACAQRPESVGASYISPTQYNGWTCHQLSEESARLQKAYDTASLTQNKTRAIDTAGVLLVGIPVGSVSGGNISYRISLLKGHKEVVEMLQNQKRCA